MKKTILLLVVVLSFIACSKSDEDNSEKQLEVNYQNMTGDWVYTTVIKTDGSQMPYEHWCSSNKDYAHIITNTKITAYFYNPVCSYQVYNCDNYYFNGNRIISCYDAFEDARVTSLTATTMKLEYDEDTVFGSLAVPVRGLILIKR